MSLQTKILAALKMYFTINKCAKKIPLTFKIHMNISHYEAQTKILTTCIIHFARIIVIVPPWPQIHVHVFK